MKTIVHPVVLELPIQLRLEAGPNYQTTETTDEQGNPQGNVDWEYPLWSFSLQYRRKSANFRDVQGFWMARRGRAYGFFFNDPTDNTDEGMGSVKLVGSDYRIVKTYPDKDNYSPVSRLITRPVSGTVDLSAVTGTDMTVDYTTGIVSGVTAEGACTFDFHAPCIFTNDSCMPTYSPNIQGRELVDWVNVGLREIRDYVIAD
jgi:uncharacterized protein (TIGR02217 family)